MYAFLKQLALPPTSLVVLSLIGVVVGYRKAWGVWLSTVALVALFVLSTPLVSGFLLSKMEQFPPLSEATLTANHAGAIVVLSAESEHSPEFGGETVGSMTLVRLRYAAHLYGLTHLPILTSGGILNGFSSPIGEQMRQSLENEFGIHDVWVERESADTLENAANSAVILRDKGVSEVYLVTHAWHMARARRVFLLAGIKVIPAPTGFTVQGTIDAGSFLPTAKGMETIYFAAHEYLGGLYYELRTLMAGPFGAPALS